MNNPLSMALSLGIITFLLTVIWGGPLVEVLRRLKIGQRIREDGPEWHSERAGTPTMGGILILLPVFLITIGVNLVNLLRPTKEGTGASILLPLFSLVGFGILGATDDLLKLRTKGEGLSARTKLIAQIVLAAVVAIFISVIGGGFQYGNTIYIPIMGIYLSTSPLIFIPMAIFVIVAYSNAVNLTDGMDGLAGTVTASAFAAYGIIALVQGQVFLVQFCFVMVGACFAFLWYNALPAQLFMGDTGSLALGATLATIAIMTGQWTLLPIIAVVPVVEVLSVILQVWYARLTGGQRLFKRSPIHYHFQLDGWSETQVVQRFWMLGILSAMVGVALAMIR